MSDQAVQNVVSSIKTVLQIFKGLLDFVKDSKKRDAEELKNRLKALEKENKTKDKEYKGTKDKLESYEKANYDIDKISKDTNAFMEDLSKDPSIQSVVHDEYKSKLITELNSAKITKEDVSNYNNLPGDKRAAIERCRQNALLSATEEIAKNRGYNVPIAKFAKDKAVFQQRIENAMSKSKEFNMKNVKNDLDKIKNDLEH